MIQYGLTGKIVAVTGAASGIGACIAQAFAMQGCRTLLIDRDIGHLAAILVRLRAMDFDVMAFPCDLAEDAQVHSLMANITCRVQHIDVLVNNAGVEFPTPISDSSLDFARHFSTLLENNVTTMARLTHALLPLLPDGASIINQSSIWGRIGVSEFSAYTASKHAVIGLTRSLAWELGHRNIRVNAVCPGWIFTPSAERSLQVLARREGIDCAAARRNILERQSIRKEITPEEVARSFLFLASDDATAITGQALVVGRGEVMA